MTDNFEIIQTTELHKQTKQQLLDLWNTEYPEKIAFNGLDEFDNYLQSLAKLKHFLLTNGTNYIFGWAFIFERENEKWFAIILSEKMKGKGYGRKLLEKLKEEELILNGWVIDHNNDKKKNRLTYHSPLKFYEKCGFVIQTDTRLELDKISAVKIKWMKENQ